jgi:hypothetical protein
LFGFLSHLHKLTTLRVLQCYQQSGDFCVADLDDFTFNLRGRAEPETKPHFLKVEEACFACLEEIPYLVGCQ